MICPRTFLQIRVATESMGSEACVPWYLPRDDSDPQVDSYVLKKNQFL